MTHFRRYFLAMGSAALLGCSGLMDKLPRDADETERDALTLPEELPLKQFDPDRMAMTRASGGSPPVTVWGTFHEYGGRRLESVLQRYKTVALAQQSIADESAFLWSIAAELDLDETQWTLTELRDARVWLDSQGGGFYVMGRRDGCVVRLGVTGLVPKDQAELDVWLGQSSTAVDAWCDS